MTDNELAEMARGVVQDRHGEEWLLWDEIAVPVRYTCSLTWGGGIGKGSIAAERLAPWRQVTDLTAVAALTADRDRLAAENEALLDKGSTAAAMYVEASFQVADLTAENEALRETIKGIGSYSDRLFDDREQTIQTVEALRAVIAAVWESGALRPCATDSRSWYSCRGDDDPTVGADCGVGQCTNSECNTRRPCYKPWHKLTPEARAALAANSAPTTASEPVAYLLHEGMGNYRAVLARGFDVTANSRLDPKPLYLRSPSTDGGTE